MQRVFSLLSILGIASLAACTVVPEGPTMLLPGPGKTQDAFRQDDTECRAGIGTLVENDAAAQQAAATAYAQCMVARGNVVQPVPMSYANTPYPYDYPYDYPPGWSPTWAGAYGAGWLGGPIIIGGWGGYWGGRWNNWHHHRPPPGGWGGGRPPPGGWGGGHPPPGGPPHRDIPQGGGTGGGGARDGGRWGGNR